MKRVLCILSNMNSGGAETFLMKVYRNLDRSKYQMDFCLNVESECFYNEEIRNLGGKIFYVPPKSKNIHKFAKELKQLVRREGYDFVLRITSNAAGFLDLKLAKQAGAKVCIARSSNSSDGTSAVVKAIHRLSQLIFSRYVDVKLAPSMLAAEYTFGKKSVKNGEVSLLNNAVDLDIFKFYPEERDNIREELGIHNKLVVGHVGRFSEQKNHLFLIDIFSEIKKQNENVVLLLVGGNGDQEEQVRKKISDFALDDSVIFTGIRSDIPQLMSAMDVFILPSFYEGMPNVVIEAQSTGLPCIISDTITQEAQLTELVEFLSLKDNTKVWAKNALEMANRPRMITKQIFVDKGYDIQSVVDRFVKLIFK